ncbi:MAG TPA: response regulator [Polyangia bacterium]|nr:response regulator [Polyangia bacterium]
MRLVRARWQRTIYSFAELDEGIDYLVFQKYFERRRDDTEVLYLTEEGFQVLRTPPPELAGSRASHVGRRRPPTAGQRPILLVEDDDAFREALEEELAGSGYDVITAKDGQEALELLATGTTPGLILLDFMMPRRNGWEVLETLQSDPRWADIPVVVMTAFSQRAPAGTKLFRKPLQLEALLSFIAEKSASRA